MILPASGEGVAGNAETIRPSGLEPEEQKEAAEMLADGEIRSVDEYIKRVEGCGEGAAADREDTAGEVIDWRGRV